MRIATFLFTKIAPLFFNHHSFGQTKFRVPGVINLMNATLACPMAT
jgi:hypothetical protein